MSLENCPQHSTQSINLIVHLPTGPTELPLEYNINEEQEQRLQTQDSLNKSECGSLDSNEESMTEMQLMIDYVIIYSNDIPTYLQPLKSLYRQGTLRKARLRESGTNFRESKLISENQTLIQGNQALISENEGLKRTIEEKEKKIGELDKKVELTQRQTEEWIFKYRQLEEQYEPISQQRTPLINQQVDELHSQIQAQDLFIFQTKKTITQHTQTIKQLRKSIAWLQQQSSKLQQLNKTLQEDNQRLNGIKSPNYYINPVYERQKLDQKLIEQVVELEALKMQKQHDIVILVECLKSTKNYLVNNGQEMQRVKSSKNKLIQYQKDNNSSQLCDQLFNSQWYKCLLAKWQSQTVSTLQSLYTLKVHSL